MKTNFAVQLNREEEDVRQTKIFKQKKKQQDVIEFLDEEDMDDDLVEYCRKHLK
jgi:hypothetical protein